MSESLAPASSVRFRRSLLVVLVALLVAAVGFLVFVVTARDVDALGLDSGEISQSQDRGTVQSQARQFVLRLLNFSPELLDDNGQMPGYRKSVSELLTAKFNDSFQTEVESAEQLAAAGSSSRGEVYATGVASIDPDSASVLVASSRVQSYPTTTGETVDSEVAAVRVVVQLVKTQGAWLVDNFAPVDDPLTAEPTSVPTLTPEPAPSGGGSPAPSGPATGQPSMTTLPPLPGSGATR